MTDFKTVQAGLAGGEVLPMARHKFTEIAMPLYGEASRTRDAAVTRLEMLSVEDFPEAWVVTPDSVEKVRG